VGKFATVGRTGLLLPSRLTAPCETADLPRSGRSACLTGLSVQSSQRKHGVAGETGRLAGTAQTTTSREKTGYEKRDTTGRLATSVKPLSTRAAPDFRAGIPSQSYPQIPLTRENFKALEALPAMLGSCKAGKPVRLWLRAPCRPCSPGGRHSDRAVSTWFDSTGRHQVVAVRSVPDRSHKADR